MNNPIICTVVTGKTLREFLYNLLIIQKQSDFLELRVDYINNLSINDIEVIKKATLKKAIFTCRNVDQGGEFEGALELQQKILQKACDLGFDFIDIDLRIISNIEIKKKQTKVICSYHNFEQTPDYITIVGFLDEMRLTGADIYKLATMVEDERDKETIYKLILSKRVNEKLIVIGMGEEGKETRVIGPLLGSYLTYASVGGSISAPGQVDADILKQIYAVLSEI